jgi:hypothetical protein
MKKILIFAILSLLLLTPAFATGPEINGLTKKVADKSGYDPNVSDTTISENVGKIIKSALTLIGTVFLILTVYAGVLWMTAQGDDAQVEKSLNILKRSAIGLIIIVSAYSLTAFVIGNVFKISDSSSTAVGSQSQTNQSSGSWWSKFTSGFKKGAGDTHNKLGG